MDVMNDPGMAGVGEALKFKAENHGHWGPKAPPTPPEDPNPEGEAQETEGSTLEREASRQDAPKPPTTEETIKFLQAEVESVKKQNEKLEKAYKNVQSWKTREAQGLPPAGDKPPAAPRPVKDIRAEMGEWRDLEADARLQYLEATEKNDGRRMRELEDIKEKIDSQFLSLEEEMEDSRQFPIKQAKHREEADRREWDRVKREALEENGINPDSPEASIILAKAEEMAENSSNVLTPFVRDAMTKFRPPQKEIPDITGKVTKRAPAPEGKTDMDKIGELLKKKHQGRGR